MSISETAPHRDKFANPLERAQAAIQAEGGVDYRELALAANQLAPIAKNSLVPDKDERAVQPLIVIAGYLAQNSEYLRDATEAYMSAALGADPGSVSDQKAVEGFVKCAEALTKKETRIGYYIAAAAYSPPGSKLNRAGEAGFFKNTENLSLVERRKHYQDAACASIPTTPFGDRVTKKLHDLESAGIYPLKAPPLSTARNFLQNCAPR